MPRFWTWLFFGNLAWIIFIIWGIHKSYYFYLNPDFNSYSTHYILELILILALNVAIFFVFLQKNSNTLKRNEKIFRLLTENFRDIIYLYTVHPDDKALFDLSMTPNLSPDSDNKINGDKERLMDSVSNAYEKTRLLERLVTDLFELSQFESSQFGC